MGHWLYNPQILWKQCWRFIQRITAMVTCNHRLVVQCRSFIFSTTRAHTISMLSAILTYIIPQPFSLISPSIHRSLYDGLILYTLIQNNNTRFFNIINNWIFDSGKLLSLTNPKAGVPHTFGCPRYSGCIRSYSPCILVNKAMELKHSLNAG
jgi:hypothetical protein